MSKFTNKGTPDSESLKYFALSFSNSIQGRLEENNKPQSQIFLIAWD